MLERVSTVSMMVNLSGSIDGVGAIGDGHQLGAILWPPGLRTKSARMPTDRLTRWQWRKAANAIFACPL
jgi:hypothetical protein